MFLLILLALLGGPAPGSGHPPAPAAQVWHAGQPKVFRPVAGAQVWHAGQPKVFRPVPPRPPRTPGWRWQVPSTP